MTRKSIALETRTARLTEAFGLEYATRLFGEEAVASLPLLKAGKHKGKAKGWLIWRKALEGGYSREVLDPLAAGSLADAWIGETSVTPRSAAMTGRWMGRTQTLAGSHSVLGAKARAAFAAEEEKRRADWEEEKAEMRSALHTAA